MLLILDRFLEKRSSTQITVLGLVFLAGVASLDHLTGAELSFSIFYLLPIVLVTWYLQSRTGYLFCAIAALLWLFIDFSSNHSYRNVLIPVWNTGVRFSFFIVISMLLRELKGRLASEKSMAITDGLTGILNAREFKKRSGDLINLASRRQHPVVLGYIDIDNFKTVNDEFGHSEGDRVLISVSRALAKCVRTTDVLGRLGGDEFAVFLHETDSAGGQVMFDRMYEELTQTAVEGGWPIGFSIGVAVFTAPPANIDDALKAADSLMYRVKKTGKNRLVYENQVQAVSAPVEGL